MSRSLPDRVAGLYYAHGLFFSSHPVIVISIAISFVLICSFPLVNLPMPGKAPTMILNTTATPTNGSETSLLYIQQILLRSSVTPWTPDLKLMDAFRGPIFEVFNLLEIIQNYQNVDTGKNLGQVCLHIESVKKRNTKKAEVLPEYNCLVLSPANFWQRSIENFNQDTNIIGTIFSHQNLQKGKISLAEILFGMSLKETGVKRYPMRTRQRVLQYTVTLFLKEYDQRFIDGLKIRLTTFYPLHKQETKNETDGAKLHIIYPDESNYSELFPLTMTFIALFFYVYFSVRKIEFVKSKIGMAFSACVTVMSSLAMTAGVCFFFGLTLNISGKEVFPYLIIIVGLENVLVLTKSVVSTDKNLDVKIRVAQGLSKEGWSITKNLLTEVTILTIGLFTFVPAIQEFCIFAIVGLLNDFFLQMVFFSTILAIDIRRTEYSSENSKIHMPSVPPLRKQHFASAKKPSIFRSKSHPRLNGSAVPTSVVAPNTLNMPILVKVPKRLRVVDFWARTRIFQRAFMIWMVVWISMIIYNSGIVDHVIHLGETLKIHDDHDATEGTPSLDNILQVDRMEPVLMTPPAVEHNGFSEQMPTTDNMTEELNKLKPLDFSPWNRLSLYHWSTILSMYNISTAGQRITILPTIKLSHAVNPDLALRISNPNDVQQFQWQSLATAALDPLDFSDIEITSRSENRGFNTNAPFVPSSPMEIFLAALLCLISVLVVAYTMVVLYRCICSRNYAEWRTSWHKQEKSQADLTTQLVLEAVPMVLEGHVQDVECIVTDGNTIASSCLAGQIRVWDSMSGEQLAHIDRNRYFNASKRRLIEPTETWSAPPDGDDKNYCSIGSTHVSVSPKNCAYRRLNGSAVDKRHSLVHEYQIRDTDAASVKRSARRSLGHAFDFPDLRSSINTRFASTKSIYGPTADFNRENGFDFGENYRRIFNDHEQWKKTVHSAKGGEYWDTEEESEIEQKEQEDSSETSPIWCMDYQENLIVVGCANGTLEFWEGTTGRFKCLFDDGSGLGITAIKFVGNRVIVARLNGSLDFLQLESYSEGQQIDWGFTSYRRTHVRTGSAGSPMDVNNVTQQPEEDLRCIKICTQKAHQQAITLLDSEGGRVITGSQDHTLKVFRLEDQMPLYTLHGHCGPISCLFIDPISPMTSGSGSQDGLLCVWDLLTGMCMYSIQAHDGAVAAITCSASYVISIGADERLCVWERFQGHLLHALPAHRSAYSLQLVMLTHHLLITTNEGSLVVWNVRSGEPIREVRLGRKDSCMFIKQMIPLRDSIVCDFGRQLRIVRFPLVSDKMD